MSFTELKTKNERINHINHKLATDDRWAVRGLLAVYAAQTADEKAVQTTSHSNGVGFNAADAELLSSFAEQVMKGRSLSAKQMLWLHRKITKYAAQLERISGEIKREPVQLSFDF